MLPNEVLAAGLDDPDRRGATRRAMDLSRRRLDAAPALARCREAVAQSQSLRDVATAIKDLFASTDWVCGLLEEWMEEARRDPFFVPPFRSVSSAIHDAALLIEEPQAAVALALITPQNLAAHKRRSDGTGSVNFSGRPVLLHFIEPGAIELGLWRAPSAGADFEARSAGTCRRLGSVRPRRGQTLEFDGARSSYVIDRTKRPAVFLQAEIRGGSIPVSREYDARTGNLIAASSASEADTRVQLLLSYLRHCRHKQAVPLFEHHATHGAFFVRWHAMREWLMLDPATAMPVLKTMARDDNHREVRNAAASAAAQFAQGRVQNGRAACPA